MGYIQRESELVVGNQSEGGGRKGWREPRRQCLAETMKINVSKVKKEENLDGGAHTGGVRISHPTLTVEKWQNLVEKMLRSSGDRTLSHLPRNGPPFVSELCGATPDARSQRDDISDH